MVVVGGIDLTAYIIGKMSFIACHEIVVDRTASVGCFGQVTLLGDVENLGNILFLKASVAGEELYTVAVERQMAGCDHYSAGYRLTVVDSSHEHCRG